MNNSIAVDRCRRIFTEDDMSRIQFGTANGLSLIILDVHGLTCRQASVFINNVIVLLFIKGSFYLEVIHGYNHGTAIKNMLWTSFQCKHVKRMYADAYNKGVTYLAVA